MKGSGRAAPDALDAKLPERAGEGGAASARAADDLRGLLSPAALAGLERRAAIRDPRDRASRAELTALLERVGLVGFELAFEIEAKLGGLRFEKSGFKLGIFAMIRDAIELGGTGSRWASDVPGALPIAAERDGTSYLARDGAVHFLGYEIDRFYRRADSAVMMLERLLRPRPEDRFAHTATLQAALGEALAKALGLVKVVEISDSVESSWAGPDLEVHESRALEPATSVHGGDPDRVAAALRQALEIVPGAEYESELDVDDALAARRG